MKKAIPLIVFVLLTLFVNCTNKKHTTDYTVEFTISEIKYSKMSKGENSPYYLYVDGTIKNISKDSVYVLPYNKYASDRMVYSYIYATIGDKHIHLEKRWGSGYLQPNEEMEIHLYSYVEPDVVDLEYLKKNFSKISFSYKPDMDSTIYYKDRENYVRKWIRLTDKNSLNYKYKKDTNEDLSEKMKRYKIPKDSADMHFVNKMIFHRTKASMHLMELRHGIDVTWWIF